MVVDFYRQLYTKAKDNHVTFEIDVKFTRFDHFDTIILNKPISIFF